MTKGQGQGAGSGAQTTGSSAGLAEDDTRAPSRETSDTYLYDDYTYAPTNVSLLSFGLSEFDDIDPYTKVFIRTFLR